MSKLREIIEIVVAAVDWDGLRSLADRLSSSSVGPGSVPSVEWGLIERSLSDLKIAEDWSGIIRLREMFDFLIKGETTGGMPIVQRINDAAIEAAEHLENRKLTAKYLHDSGESYHRQGYQKKSIEAFERAVVLYKEEGDLSNALKSYYFASLPYRALGERKRALEILNNVLQETAPDDLWRGNPLEVMGWMTRDEGDFAEAEKVFREALALYKRLEGEESIHVVQTLADLGEVIGLQARFSEASAKFEQSLAIVKKFGGQYDRQEARTKLKYAEMLNREREYDRALGLLDQADDSIRGYGHYYDLLWQIEFARAVAFIGKRQWSSAMRKFRAVLRYRNEIGLSNSDFGREFFRRLRWGTG